jgi:5-methyltetrahydropteroyltriglutamate--homocysteine methyltransferase
MGSRILIHNLGYPRMGDRRQLKKAVESFWDGKLSETELQSFARDLRRINWVRQKDAGIDIVPSNDFSLYDHVLDTAFMFGAVPGRFAGPEQRNSLTTYFAMARGREVNPGECDCRHLADVHAMEMTKWFDTNYHYIVPEFHEGQRFALAFPKPITEFQEALALGIKTKPVLLGPFTFLKLGKIKGPKNRWELLPGLIEVYVELLKGLENAGADWVQIDEPAFSLDLDSTELHALAVIYRRIAGSVTKTKIIVANYFGNLARNLETFVQLPVAALHCDFSNSTQELDAILASIPPDTSLSLGLVSGRNVWKNNYQESVTMINRAVRTLGAGRILIAPASSLLHVPIALRFEEKLDPELRDWLAFADEKLNELSDLRAIVEGNDERLKSNTVSQAKRKASERTNSFEVESRSAAVRENDCFRNSPFIRRRELQQKRLNLVRFPTTTIGSFPQTKEVRAQRSLFKKGRISESEYEQFLQTETERVIRLQEEMGLDVLVHGEFERTDMVEFFGEQLEGFAFTENGWVQSYGSRCVKPPILFGDVSRPGPMTVRWARFAQALTSKPLKGMLTGPITILQWSFVRDDQPRSVTARQIALAIRDEVLDLEAAGIAVIQVDEPALREGLPLRSEDRPEYLRWAVEAFKLSTAGVRDETQIHTHMCYCEFNDIIDSIARMDADVISFESSRSNMELLEAFREFDYPNDVGPGIYDIHSPLVPSEDEMIARLHRAKAVLAPERIWVNPDCGLKTRAWPEVESSLRNLVGAARRLREE